MGFRTFGVPRDRNGWQVAGAIELRVGEALSTVGKVKLFEAYSRRTYHIHIVLENPWRRGFRRIRDGFEVAFIGGKGTDDRRKILTVSWKLKEEDWSWETFYSFLESLSEEL